MKRVFAVMVCAAAMSALAACGSDEGSAVPSTSTVTVSESATTGRAPAQPDSGVGDAPATDPGNSGQAAPTASQPFVNEANTPVDTQSFYTDGGLGEAYYFQSPTGNVKCGIGFADSRVRAGCEATSSVPSNTGVTCKNAGASLYATTLGATKATSLCSNQPFVVGNSQNQGGAPGGKVLEYGQYIAAGGVVCRSTSYGITCTSEKGDFGFVLARDRNNLFG